jgi:hypothetical protein
LISEAGKLAAKAQGPPPVPKDDRKIVAITKRPPNEVTTDR